MASASDAPIHIHLLCMERQHIDAFQAAVQTHKLPSSIPISIHECTLGDLDPTVQFDAIVSPANSFGRMDGGFDDALSRAFTPQGNYHGLTRVAQAALYKEYRGFLPPGSCLLVDLEGQEELKENPWGCKYLALCPTMRVPQNVNWDREVVYECIWTLLAAIERHNRRVDEINLDDQLIGSERQIRTVLMTPLATGCGFWSAKRWAEQTVLAIKHFVNAGKNEQWKFMQWRAIGDVTREVEKTHGL
jgi:O-acetyl-ADP-ribose deacetylase (regulator of RNase III)